MPPRPQQPCSCPGCESCLSRCPSIVTSGRCPTCKSQQQAAAPHDAERKKIYNSARWKGLRRQVRRENPWCATGCGKTWTHLDHEPPLRDVIANGGDPYARPGVQGLCTSCHSAKTLQEIRARR